MVIKTEEGWLGSNRSYYGSAAEALRSFRKQHNLYTDFKAPLEIEQLSSPYADLKAFLEIEQPSSLKDAPLLTFTDQWKELAEHLDKHPEFLYELSPRKFEELVAEFFLADGHGVELTPAIRDGGRDILVTVENNMARHLYLVECKRYAPQNKVEVALVRSLYGVVEAERATLGMIITTSTFTSGAIDFARGVQNRISLKDYTAVREMLKRYKSKS